MITRDCEAGFDPFAEGGSAGVEDSYAPAGTFPNHLFVNSTNLHESATFTYSRDSPSHELATTPSHASLFTAPRRVPPRLKISCTGAPRRLRKTSVLTVAAMGVAAPR